MDGLEDSDEEVKQQVVAQKRPPVGLNDSDDSDEDEDEGGSEEEDLGRSGIDLRRTADDEEDESEDEDDEEDDYASKRKRAMNSAEATGVAGKRGSKKARSMLSSLVHMEAQEDSDEGNSNCELCFEDC